MKISTEYFNQRLRLSLVLNLIFTFLSFKIVLSYQFFKVFTHFLSLLKGYINIGIFLTIDETGTRGNFSFFVLSVLSSVIISFYIFSPDLFWKIIFSPLSIIKKGVSIWKNIKSWWIIPINIVLSYIYFLAGFILTAFLWVFTIFIVLKTFSSLSEIINRSITSGIFDYLVFFLFLCSWALTFRLTYFNPLEKWISQSFDYKEGDKAIHTLLGSGEILNVQGSSINQRITVDFQEVFIKRLILKYQNLKRFNC